MAWPMLQAPDLETSGSLASRELERLEVDDTTGATNETLLDNCAKVDEPLLTTNAANENTRLSTDLFADQGSEHIITWTTDCDNPFTATTLFEASEKSVLADATNEVVAPMPSLRNRRKSSLGLGIRLGLPSWSRTPGGAAPNHEIDALVNAQRLLLETPRVVHGADLHPLTLSTTNGETKLISDPLLDTPFPSLLLNTVNLGCWATGYRRSSFIPTAASSSGGNDWLHPDVDHSFIRRLSQPSNATFANAVKFTPLVSSCDSTRQVAFDQDTTYHPGTHLESEDEKKRKLSTGSTDDERSLKLPRTSHNDMPRAGLFGDTAHKETITHDGVRYFSEFHPMLSHVNSVARPREFYQEPRVNDRPRVRFNLGGPVDLGKQTPTCKAASAAEAAATQEVLVTQDAPPLSESLNLSFFHDRGCICKRSRCLKLYCRCFQAMIFCDKSACRCRECYNIPEHDGRDGVRRITIEKTVGRRPDAFNERPVKKTGEGCACKKNRCLKKYCDCFANGVRCSKKCNCSGCMNVSNDDGSQETTPADANFAVRLVYPTIGNALQRQGVPQIMSHQGPTETLERTVGSETKHRVYQM